jgi:hypothetical protein
MLKKVGLTLGVIFSIALLSVAQVDLNGRIHDEEGKAVPYASLVLLSPTDSLFSAFQISTTNGEFQFKNIEEGNYVLVTASVGYGVDSTSLSLNAQTSDLLITLLRSEMTLKEVMKRAKRIPLMFNGDTMVYNADNFNTTQNANVEDLLKKLPGLTINKDGSVTSNGENITRVLVNGKEFFGGNLEAATKNIDAALVDKVEVIEKEKEQDELNPEGGENREKVINLVLKKDLNQGYFGTVSAAYGTEEQYRVRGNLNFFREKTQLSIIGGLNNLDQQLYGWQDRSKFGAFAISPLDDWNFMTFGNSGVTTYRGIGANLNFEPGEHTKTNVSYMYGNDDGLQIRENFSEVYIDESSLLSDYEENAESNTLSHQLNWTLEYKPDTLNRIKLRAQASLTDQRNEQNSLQFNSRSDSIINSGINLRDQQDNMQKFAAKLNWIRDNKNGKGRWYNSIYAGGSRHANTDDAFFRNAPRLLNIPQEWQPNIEQQLQSTEFTVATNSSYTMILSEKIELSPGIKWMSSVYQHDFDWIVVNDGLLPQNSPQGNVNLQLLEGFLYLKWNIDSFSVLHFTPKYTMNLESRAFTTSELNTFNNPQYFFTPSLYFRSAKPQQYRISVHFSTDIGRPGVQQMLPVVNNTNPFNTVIGNIQLQNSLNYQGGARLMKMYGIEKRLYYSVWFRVNTNALVTDRTISAENIARSAYINFGNNSNGNHRLGFSWPIKKIKTVFDLELSYSHNRSFLLQNDQVLQSQTNNSGAGIGFEMNEFEKVSFDGGFELFWNQGRVGEIQNNAFLSYMIDAEVMYSPWDALELSSNIDWEIFGDNNTNDITSIPIWSASCNYTIDKKKRWSVGIEAYDLLDKNQNLWRWWSANSYSENRSNAIQRYVLLNVTYRIKQKTKDQPKWGH